jgi:hypothetical protein
MTKDEALDLALEFFETMQRYKGTRSNIFIRFEPTATGDYVDLREFDEKAKPIITAIKQARSAPVQEPVAHCEAGPGHCQQCHLEDRSLALSAAVRYVQNNTPKLVSDEICMALTTPPAAPVQQPLGKLCVFDDADSEFGWSYDISGNAEQHRRLKELDGAMLYTTPSAQPAFVQEPEVRFKCTVIDEQHPNGVPLEQWGSSAQRQWVGLTDEEYFEIGQRHWVTSTKIELIHAEIEAKLKEKNT